MAAKLSLFMTVSHIICQNEQLLEKKFFNTIFILAKLSLFMPHFQVVNQTEQLVSNKFLYMMDS